MDKVILRPLTVADLDAFMVWATDPEVTKHLRWETYASRAAAEEFFETVVKKHPWFQAIVVDEEIIGSMTLKKAIVRKGNIEDLYLYAITR